MAASDIVQRVRQHVYGNGFGESPSIIQGASDASETITNPTITFDVATDEGAKLAPGDILSTYDSTSQATAFELYVLSVSTDTVTAINGYNGSDQSAADELDGMLFELNPFKSEYLIWSKIETVFDNMLWPYVWKYNTQSVTTPDQSSYQNEVPAAIFQIEGAWQQYGPEWVPIAWELQRNLHTSVSSTGSLATLNVFDSSTVYLSTREKYLSSDTLPDSVQEVVALGAAAMLVGADRNATSLEKSSKDSQFRGEMNPADALWRDFITLRQSIADDLASQVEYFEYRR